MYKANVTIPKDVMLAYRTAPVKARDNFGPRLARNAVPKITRKAQELLGRAPGPVSRPFEFATDKSRRWYFANRKAPYRRTGQIERGWQARLDRRLTEGQLTIINIYPAAGYVYGPGNPSASYRQVPGHRRTGWGRGFDALFRQLEAYATDVLIEEWVLGVDEALP